MLFDVCFWLFLFGSFVIVTYSLFCEMPLALIFINNYENLEDLRVHWYHLFVSIRYHNFLCFAIWNVVQSDENELV